MNPFPRAWLCAALLLAALPLCSRASADPLLQKLTFEAMNTGDDEVVQAVTLLHRKGFLERFSTVVREHIQNQDGTAAKTAAKIKEVTVAWIKQSFTTKQKRVTAASCTAIKWKPGSNTAGVSYRFDLKNFGGLINTFPSYKGHATVDVRTWQISNWSHQKY